MDRKITNPQHTGTTFFKEFEYIDLFPYSIALLLLTASIYILQAFIHFAHNMH